MYNEADDLPIIKIHVMHRSSGIKIQVEYPCSAPDYEKDYEIPVGGRQVFVIDYDGLSVPGFETLEAHRADS